MKLAFVRRWPQRSYRPDLSQLTIACSPADATCTVSGVVSYDCRSDERGAASSGSATFEMGLRMRAGTFRVISEAGRTLSRE